MRYTIFICFFAISHIVVGQHIMTHEETEWLNENVVSFSHPISQTELEEFTRIDIPENVKIIGLGEANHGTKEFHILKHKLAMFLIKYKQFNTIVIEFPFSHGLLLNDYVIGKNENGLKILTDQESSEYHTSQMIDFIEEIKLVNQTRADSNKIQFLGIDIFGKPYAFKRLTHYFIEKDSVFSNKLLKYKHLSENYYKRVSTQNSEEFAKLSGLILEQLENNKAQLIKNSSIHEYKRMVRLAELMGVEWKGNQRAIEDAANTLFFLNEKPETKVLFLAHNMHVGRFGKDVGEQLSKKLKSEYFPIATDYNTGSFTLKNMTDRNNVFSDTVVVIPMKNSFADNILKLNGEFHYLKFPESANKLNKWIFKSNYIARTGRGFNQPFKSAEEFRSKYVLPKKFDAIFIFVNISPTKILK
jgi:erythromycin esterase